MIPREHLLSFFQSLITPDAAEEASGFLQILRPIIVLMSTTLFLLRILRKCKSYHAQRFHRQLKTPTLWKWRRRSRLSNAGSRRASLVELQIRIFVKMIFDPVFKLSRSVIQKEKKIH